MQDKLSRIITPAYTPEEYEKILAMSEDRDELAKDWAQWRQATDEKKAEAATQDVNYVEQHINALGLFAYCVARGIPINARARTDYAHLLYDRQSTESSISSANSKEEEHPTTRTHSYTPPVDKLLTYTDIEEKDPFPKISYAETFGIGPEHIPELIRMATDDYLEGEDANNFEFAAPLHAVNALIELHAESAIEPLLMHYDKASENKHEWMQETLVEFYETIGPVALPAMEQFLADPSHHDSARNYVAEIIGRMAKKHPEARAECVAVAMRRLADFAVNEPDLNGCLIISLVEMKAVEAAPLMEAAFASERVDEDWMGDWDEVQYELGMKERPAREERVPLLSAQSASTRSIPDTVNVPHKFTKKAPPSKKAKNKMAKASKKANRRKK